MTNYVQNPDFYPQDGYHHQGWYRPNAISYWRVQYGPQGHGFFITTWPSFYSEAGEHLTCLVLFMNRMEVYFQQNITLQAAQYWAFAQMAFKVEPEENQRHHLMRNISMYVYICQKQYTAVVKRTLTKIKVQIGHFVLMQTKICLLKIIQTQLAEKNFQGIKVFISDVTVTKTKPIKRKFVQKRFPRK